MYVFIPFHSYSANIEYVKLEKLSMLAAISFALIKTQRTENFHSFALSARCKTVIHMRRRAGRTNTRAHTNKSQTDTGKWQRGKQAGRRRGRVHDRQRCCNCICAFPVSARMFRWSIFKCAVTVRLVSCCSVVQFGIRSLCAGGSARVRRRRSAAGAKRVLEEVGSNRKRNRPVRSPIHLDSLCGLFAKLNTNSQFLHIWLQLHCSGLSLNTQTHTHAQTHTFAHSLSCGFILWI